MLNKCLMCRRGFLKKNPLNLKKLSGKNCYEKEKVLLDCSNNDTNIRQN